MIFAIVLLLLGRVVAQSFETGGLLGAEYEMRILKGWHWGAEAEFRFDENFTHFNRFKVAVGTDYTFWKKRIKIGVGYGYLNYHKDDYFESRHRITGSLTLAEKFGNWKLSYRAASRAPSVTTVEAITLSIPRHTCATAWRSATRYRASR